MNIAISSDHRGRDAVKHLADRLADVGHNVTVMGTAADEGPTDYPDQAAEVGRSVADGINAAGILICGTGIGMSIAANKVKGVRAAAVHDELTAQLSRSHNDANVLCVSADLLGERKIDEIVDIWLRTDFEGGRHERRVSKIGALECTVEPKT
ncbi:MAG: ribose 5-phosphate isomerase B [Planctomycetota bacterium]